MKKRPSIKDLKSINKKPVKGSKNHNAKSHPSFKKWIVLTWLLVYSPIIGMFSLLLITKAGLSVDLPDVAQLDNPKNNLATEIISIDGEVIGKYYLKENRQKIYYEQISPNVISALIATEDERYYSHSGIDAQSFARAIIKLGRDGGGSTITQQLAKMLFSKRPDSKIERLMQKLGEWIIAVQLEKRYTKEEILAMYLNRFDFIYNAVGLKSAAKIYFGTQPELLDKEQAAVLVGMAKNPSMYNPKQNPKNAAFRKKTVLLQWRKNSENEAAHLPVKLSEEEYAKFKEEPIVLNYNPDSHTSGLAPYFREELKKEVKALLSSNKIKKADGSSYDLYNDGLKIYTSIDSRIQKHAESAVEKHLGNYLQEAFWKHSKGRKNWPYDHKTEANIAQAAFDRGIKDSERYKIMKGILCPNCKTLSHIDNKGDHYLCTSKYEDKGGYKWKSNTDKEIEKAFNTPTKMNVFTWENKAHSKDTMMSPLDSIRYYKSILQAGLIAINPHTGYVNAWVGGGDYQYFKYDHAKLSKRQVGSTFKPFVYATAFRDKGDMLSPCTEIIDKEYCFDDIAAENGSWCPGSGGRKFDYKPMSLKYALASSYNPVTAWVMQQTSPHAVLNLAGAMGIDTSDMLAVKSMALGVFDVNVLEMTGAYATLVNHGMYLKPQYLLKIEDKNGNVIYQAEAETRTVLDENTAYQMIDCLKGVTSGVRSPHRPEIAGTSLRLRGAKTKSRPYAGINTPVAGKTGTTQNNSDGWFMGCTPDLVVGVWVGAEERGVRFSSTNLGQGANMALPIYGYLMNDIYQDKNIKISQGDFTPPPGYQQCTSASLEEVNVDTDTPDF